MALLDRSASSGEITGAERAFEVTLGSLGGFEVRPTRLFVWKGPEREESERLVPLADSPVGLEYPRRESTLRVGAVAVRSRGNPLMTIALASAIAFRRWADGEPGGRPPQKPA
jgi:hypothetical protein